jgi:hypothetical protein
MKKSKATREQAEKPQSIVMRHPAASAAENNLLSDNDRENSGKEPRPSQRLLLFAGAASLLWIAFSAYFFLQHQPDRAEFGLGLQDAALLIAGVSGPLILIWLIALILLQLQPRDKPTSAPAQNIDEFLQPFHIADRHIDSLSHSIQQKISGINAAVQFAGEQVITLADERQDFASLVTEIEHRTTEMRLMAENLATALRQAASEARGDARMAGEKMTEHAALLTISSRQTMQTLEEIGNSLADYTRKLHETSLIAEQAVARVGSSLHEQQASLNETLDALSSRTEIIRTAMISSEAAFASQTSLLKETAQDTASSLDATVARMLEQTEILSASAAAVNDRFENIGATLAINSREVETASLGALNAADLANQALASQSNELVRATTEIEKSADKLISLTTRLENKAKADSTIAFARTSSFVIEALASQAIDIHRGLNTDIPDDVWQKYLKGDRSIFARRTVRLANRQTRELIAKKFKEDGEFREHSLRYLKEFEKLMAHATSADPEGPLSITLVSSEMGKLYVLLAQSLNRFS